MLAMLAASVCQVHLTRPRQDLYSLFIRKMQDAPPQEVTIVGEDWEEPNSKAMPLCHGFQWGQVMSIFVCKDWEMGGPDKDARFNDVFEASFDL